MLSTTTCAEHCAPTGLHEMATIFTFASARVFAMWANVPGRFSRDTMSCFTLAIACLRFIAWNDEIALGLCAPAQPLGKDIP